MIQAVDEFILFDDCQYTRRDWRNRNIIKTHQGSAWLTIPVKVKDKNKQSICDVHVDNDKWVKNHLACFRHHYANAPYFSEMYPVIEEWYDACHDEELLYRVNYCFLKNICDTLEIRTDLTWSMDYGVEGECATSKLLSLCMKSGATHYLSGPNARCYLDESLFREKGIEVVWMSYDNYPEYNQVHPPFLHQVTVLDVLLHLGPEASLESIARYSMDAEREDGVCGLVGAGCGSGDEV